MHRPNDDLMEPVQKRVFVVGCSRSGTTVLQVSLAAHPQVHSFPETFFFKHATGKYGPWLQWLGVPSGHERFALRHVLEELGYPALEEQLPERLWPFGRAVRVYLRMLDAVARAHGKTAWVEKTPLHVFRLPLIERYVPGARIVHIIRDGRDVVASLCDRAAKHPGQFPGEDDPAFGIDRWNRAVAVSRRYLGRPGHAFVLYEDLVRAPEAVVERLCSELELPYDARMVAEEREVARTVIPEHRTWIAEAAYKPRPQASKFERLFTAEEQARITAELDLEVYEHMKNNLPPGE